MLELLNLGPNFAISIRNAHNDFNAIVTSFNKFERLLRLKHMFYQSTDDIDTVNKFRVANPSFPASKTHQYGHALEQYIRNARESIKTTIQFQTTTNKYKRTLPNYLQTAISKLQNATSTIIRPADKNLGFVVLNRQWYRNSIHNNLNDTTKYKYIVNPPSTQSLLNGINNILDKYKQSQHIKNFILQNTGDKKPFSTIYGLPKIHKQEPLQLRFICPAYGSILYYASRFIHLMLEPVLLIFPQNLKNTITLLNDLQHLEFGSNCVISTADVISLYPSIPIVDCIQKNRSVLMRHGKFTTTTVNFIIELSTFILTNHFIMFENQYYLQIKGIAMGLPCAVVLSCIYMAELERLYVLSDNFTTTGSPFPFYYKRFIDDSIGVFANRTRAIQFWSGFNDAYPMIQFEWIIHHDTIDFLDLTLFKTPASTTRRATVWTKRFQSRLYEKSISMHLYVPFNSAHPRTCLQAFIKAELYRYRRNCSLSLDYFKAKTALYNRLIQRHYPVEFLNPIFSELDPDRHALLHPTINGNADNVFSGNIFITPYNITAQSISIRKAIQFPKLFSTGNAATDSIFEKPLYIAYTVNNKLRSILK